MNRRVKELMIEAGYAAPELASRAHKLVELLLEECVKLCDKNFVGAVGTAVSAHNSGVAKCQQSIKDTFDC